MLLKNQQWNAMLTTLGRKTRKRQRLDWIGGIDQVSSIVMKFYENENFEIPLEKTFCPPRRNKKNAQQKLLKETHCPIAGECLEWEMELIRGMCNLKA
jgi:hypothetical protein